MLEALDFRRGNVLRADIDYLTAKCVGKVRQRLANISSTFAQTNFTLPKLGKR